MVVCELEPYDYDTCEVPTCLWWALLDVPEEEPAVAMARSKQPRFQIMNRDKHGEHRHSNSCEDVAVAGDYIVSGSGQ